MAEEEHLKIGDTVTLTYQVQVIMQVDEEWSTSNPPTPTDTLVGIGSGLADLIKQDLADLGTAEVVSISAGVSHAAVE